MKGTASAIVDTIRANAETEYDTDTVARVTWASITDPGDIEVGRLVSERGAVTALEIALDSELDTVDGIALGRMRRRLGPRTSVRVADSLRLSAEQGWSIVTPLCSSWAAQCDDLRHAAPLCLWIAGNPALLQSATLGFVGSDTPSQWGRHASLTLGAALADKGWVLVGTATPGVDWLAHCAAMAVNGGAIAVLPCGVDQDCSPSDEILLSEIEERGAVVSEFAPGTVPTAARRLRRDFLLALLSTKVVVVEAEVDSDATVIGEQARLLGRHVGILDTGSGEAERSGCRQLRRWFGARSVTSVVDVDRL